MKYLTRLEYLTRDGWQVGHAGVELLDPEAYVKRLRTRGKFGRATVLDTGQIYEAEDLPDPSTLIPPTDGTRAHTVGEWCDLCFGEGQPPHDGSCLI